MSKPVVFLSHAKEDKVIVEKIANDLRSCRIDSWYDEWEIPPGSSFRNKIFNDGIAKCDSMFVYLTEASIKSYWVEKELDAAFIEQSRKKLTSVLTFVSSEEIRNKLSPDLASLHSPIINQSNYQTGLLKIVSTIFESKIIKTENDKNLQSENELLRLKVDFEKLKSEYNNLQNLGNKSVKDTIQMLDKINFETTKGTICILEIFKMLISTLSTGSNYNRLIYTLMKKMGIDEDSMKFEKNLGVSFDDLVYPLMINSIIVIQPSSGDTFDTFYLSETGKQIAAFMTNPK